MLIAMFVFAGIIDINRLKTFLATCW